jgi:transcriptional regulator with XRE-family HTH domain
MAKQSSEGASRMQAVRIAERIKQARLKLAITQDAMARKAGLSRSAYIHYEQGNAIPGGLELLKLSRALGKSPNYLLSGSDLFFTDSKKHEASAVINPHTAVLRLAMTLPMLDAELVQALANTTMALVCAKLTKPQLKIMEKVWKDMEARAPELIQQMESPLTAFAEELYPTKSKRKK